MRVNPSWYAAELFSVPHVHISPLSNTFEKDVMSNKDSPKIKQNLLTALVFHELLCRHGPQNIREGLDVYLLIPVQFS